MEILKILPLTLVPNVRQRCQPSLLLFTIMPGILVGAVKQKSRTCVLASHKGKEKKGGKKKEKKMGKEGRKKEEMKENNEEIMTTWGYGYDSILRWLFHKISVYQTQLI